MGVWVMGGRVLGIIGSALRKGAFCDSEEGVCKGSIGSLQSTSAHLCEGGLSHAGGRVL